MKTILRQSLFIGSVFMLLAVLSSNPRAQQKTKDQIKTGRNNLLLNPGLEKGSNGWIYPEWSKAWALGGFEISEKVSRRGKRSAWLHFEGKPAPGNTVIRGIMQELKPGRFPEVISGYYKIDNWQRGALKQYLQFVVIVWQNKYNAPNHQIRYILSGVTHQPYNMSNAHYIILNKQQTEPVEGKWIRFETNVLKDFQEKWKETPAGYEKIQVFFEARYDSWSPGSPKVLMDVYYDDLFVGYTESPMN